MHGSNRPWPDRIARLIETRDCSHRVPNTYVDGIGFCPVIELDERWERRRGDRMERATP